MRSIAFSHTMPTLNKCEKKHVENIVGKGLLFPQHFVTYEGHIPPFESDFYFRL